MRFVRAITLLLVATFLYGCALADLSGPERAMREVIEKKMQQTLLQGSFLLLEVREGERFVGFDPKDVSIGFTYVFQRPGNPDLIFRCSASPEEFQSLKKMVGKTYHIRVDRLLGLTFLESGKRRECFHDLYHS